MLHSRHIVVADFPDGKTVTLYQGPDVTKAEKALGAAVAQGKAEAVIVFHHPVMSRVRHPIEEALQSEQRAKEAESAKNADSNRLTHEAKQKRERAKELTAEAEKLEQEAAAHLDKTKEPSK